MNNKILNIKWRKSILLPTASLRASLFLLGCLAMAPAGHGQWSYWYPGSGDWSDASLWDPLGTLPDNTRNVDIRGAVNITGPAASASSYVNGGTVNVMTGGGWTNSNLFIADLTSGQNGVMTISGGGTVATSGEGRVESAAEARVTGAGSLWDVASYLQLGIAIGGTAGGTLEVSADGSVKTPEIFFYNNSTLVVGAPSGQTAVAPGNVDVLNLTGGAESTLIFNHADTSGSYAFSANINGINLLHESGITTLSSGIGSVSSATVAGGNLYLKSPLMANEISVKNGGNLTARLTPSSGPSFAPLSAPHISVEAGGTLNAFSGLTVPAGGSVVVNGTLSHLAWLGAGTTSLSITDGTTLSGNGRLSATTITIGDDGILAPGNSPGKLEVSALGGHIWEGGGIYEWEINAAGGVQVANWDLIDVIHGPLNITADSSNPFILKLSSLNTGNTPGALIDWDPTQNYDWPIASVTGPLGIIDGFDPGDIFIDYESAFDDYNTIDGVFSLNHVGNSLVLHYEANDITAIPEPGSAVALALLLTSSVGLHRQRGKKSRSQGS